jgi:hypothetical protein
MASRLVPRSLTSACVAAAIALSGSAQPVSAHEERVGPGAAQPVTIRGYVGDAMEPFVSPDGKYLFFNNSNQAPVTSLRYATRVNATTFDYAGELNGANDPPALSAVPTLDRDGNLYFISTRSYAQTLSTVYTGTFQDGQVSGVHLVPGVVAPRPGLVDFDVDVSADGENLYVSVGTFGAGPSPSSAHLTVYSRQGPDFVANPEADQQLAIVNETAALVYAPAVSDDGLDLFFTAADPGAAPSIYEAVRGSTDESFADVQQVAGAVGFVEAPALGPHGHLLYFHRRVGNTYMIFVVRL